MERPIVTYRNDAILENLLQCCGLSLGEEGRKNIYRTFTYRGSTYDIMLAPAYVYVPRSKYHAYILKTYVWRDGKTVPDTVYGIWNGDIGKKKGDSTDNIKTCLEKINHYFSEDDKGLQHMISAALYAYKADCLAEAEAEYKAMSDKAENDKKALSA